MTSRATQQYPREIAGRLLQGVRGMRDSLIYQAVLEDGRIEGRAEGRAGRQTIASGQIGAR